MATQISNGTTVPHATDYADLLTKLKTFALANGWSSLEDTADKLVLKGTGAGTDEIFVAIQKYAISGTDTYGWNVNGYTGYQSGLTFLQQPGAIQTTQVGTLGYPSMPLWNSTIPYWFIVNSRRIIVVTKISTTYQMCYMGFYLPFASPNQYPYPLTIGGSSKPNLRWSGIAATDCMFWRGVTSAASHAMMTRLAGGDWYSDGNQSNINAGGFSSKGMYPYNQADILRWRQAIDGSGVLCPVEIHQNQTTPTVMVGRLGELEGVYHVSGFGQASENIITIASVDYLVVQNIFRTTADQYCAIKLT